MRFQPTPLPGALVIDLDLHEDERGFFARTWCAQEFATHGIATQWAQCNLSANRRAGTLRGLHYQAAPFGEAKLIRCTRGALYDVLVDVRPGSPTQGRWFAVELSADNRRMVFAPAGLAHGFQTLADDTEVFYQMSVPYHATAARGVRWDDPRLAITWPPCRERIVSPRDQLFPDWQPCDS